MKDRFFSSEINAKGTRENYLRNICVRKDVVTEFSGGWDACSF